MNSDVGVVSSLSFVQSIFITANVNNMGVSLNYLKSKISAIFSISYIAVCVHFAIGPGVFKLMVRQPHPY